MKKEQWELEGFSSYEEWVENEKRWIENAKNNAASDIKMFTEIFEDPKCRRILGPGILGTDKKSHSQK